MQNTKILEEELLRVQKDIQFYLERITRLHGSLKQEEEKLYFRLQREKVLKTSLEEYSKQRKKKYEEI